MWAAGRRPRGLCSRRGLVQRDTPPIFFSVLAEKKTGRARSKRKGRFGALRCSGPPRDGGRRISACSDLGRPSGTLCSSAIPVAADPWRIVPTSSGWLSYCLCFSFRCRSRSRAGEPAAAKIGAGCIPVLPRAKGFPKGSAFPSLTSTRECQPSPAGGRRSALAQTDPPNIFSFPPGAAHFLFDVSKRKWGRIPHGQCPLAGARPLRPPFGGPPSLGWQKSIPWISLFFK